MRFFALLAVAAMVFTTASAEVMPTVEASEEVLENEETEDRVVVRRRVYIRKNNICYIKALPARRYSKTYRTFSGYGAAKCSLAPYRTTQVGAPRMLTSGATATKIIERNSYYRCTRSKMFRTRKTTTGVLTYNPYRPVICP